MRWTKRTTALLAASLAAVLLSTTVYGAGGTLKAPPREERLTLPWEADRSAKLPELTVVEPEELKLADTSGAGERDAKAPSLTVVAPEPAAMPEAEAVKPAESSVSGGGKTDGPCFPEAEDWQLLLVNPWNEMPEDYEVTLKTLPDGNKVDQRAYEDLNAMLQACRDAGLRPKICSSYRTMSKQTYLYNNKIARLRNAGYSRAAAEAEAGRWVARPGTSEHQLGLALDIVSQSYQALTKKQEKTAEQKWLMEHCWEYGFILRYPNDKSEITGIGYEPWHYRYVGRDVALDIRDSGLCMEEYLLLREETLAAEKRI